MHSIPRRNMHLVTVVLRFGSRYSTFAYQLVFETKCVQTPSNKTASLFNSAKALVAFGDEADDKYMKIKENNEHADYYFFKQFPLGTAVSDYITFRDCRK